jgi:type VI secretion system secreted protein VgrG
MSDPVDYRARFVGRIGGKELVLEGFTATERLSVPFTVEVTCVSPDGPIDIMALLGAGVGIEIKANDKRIDRAFHGVVFEAEAEGRARKEHVYRLTLRPWLSMLTLGQNMRIFQHKSVPDIIIQIFKEWGLSNFQFKSSTTASKPREYCVQFKESDFDFISRLMEEEGIYYFFEHTANVHKMVLCDGPSCHTLFSETLDVMRGEVADMATPHLNAWDRGVQPSIVKATLQDSHFRMFGQSLQGDDEQPDAGGHVPKAESYDYPGGYGYFEDSGSLPGRPYAQVRLEEARADRDTMYGEGITFAVAAGSRIKVKEEPDPTPKVSEYLVVEVSHSFSDQQSRGGGGGGGADFDGFDIRLEAVPATTHWRAPWITEKPVANGPQIATVVGVNDQVIEVDEWGRVRVHFDWDRGAHPVTQDAAPSGASAPAGAKPSDNRTCWIRVSQGWADNGFGAMHIPRVGEEVIVDFLDGDPDRPIITGRVYNNKNVQPYKLPDEKTKSYWKSKSVGDSGSYDESEEKPPNPGYNELRFEDKGGSEEFYVHAQRIFNSLIRLDETRKTGRDTTVRVGRNRKVDIKKNETVTIETGDETRKIEEGKRTTEIKGNDSLTVQTGDYTMKVSAGQATFDVATKITIKCGGSTIVMDPASIQIKSTLIKIEASAVLQTKAGTMSQNDGGPLMIIKGAMTMIN